MKKFHFKLYVIGDNGASGYCARNIHRICEEHLPGLYEITVIDMLESPELARDAKVFVAPALVREYPLPSRRIIGDLSNSAKVAHFLGITSGLR